LNELGAIFVGTEIERKFLVDTARLPALPEPLRLRQGYLCTEPTVRVRLSRAPSGEERARLTIKGPGLFKRTELEYEVPPADAPALLALCTHTLSKLRYRLGRWEVDHFLDLPRGDFWLAELELEAEHEPFEKPPWALAEVTHDPAYSNTSLVSAKRHP
jgi:adenylate cyclase